MTPGEQILIMRQKIIQIYKSYQRVILPLGKFIAVLGILLAINNTIGVIKPLTGPVVTFSIALISGFLSASLMMILIMGIVAAHILSANFVIGVGLLGVFIVSYVLFIRLYPKESLLIVLTIVAFNLNMEYVILLIVPLFGGMACLVALIMGVAVSFIQTPLISVIQTSEVIEKIQDAATPVLDMLNQNMLNNKEMFVTMAMFLVVFIVIYAIRNLAIDYAPYVAVGVGAVINLLGFGLAILFLELEINLLGLMLTTVVGAVIAILSAVLLRPLDYSRAETVQFEDEDNYYYVKVIPKICISMDTTKVKQVYTSHGQKDIGEIARKNYTEEEI